MCNSLLVFFERKPDDNGYGRSFSGLWMFATSFPEYYPVCLFS
jgi:hypothetical protein